ncbi:MAG: tRNA (N6-isopentenyl adenosine(37)-C2)-methylthiotransferase MiaB [Planctomycetes bacterium]|nr:tRNA (N6-isopentenyl adenosine(37)-C2)-methylthiotransferase MiaB [Planctomycetota bacterium]
MSNKSVYIETFGCQMNLADTEMVVNALNEDGYESSDTLDDADLVIYNTCSVRDNAEAKIRGRLDYLKGIKRERKDLKIAIMGCMAQREKSELLQKYPHLDLVVGTDQFVHMPQLLKQLEDHKQLAATDFGNFEDRNWGSIRKEGINAWIPVMRGCNYNCTYCVVPHTRGKEKSRDPGQIEDDVRKAVAQGHTQVTLLGQTIDAYGKTLGDGSNFASLLRRVNDIEGLKRVRYITSHPKDITDELLDTIAELPKVCKHLHVPAQCGSSRILRLMGRRYTREYYLEFVARARERMPDVELLTDIIVGFPRETEEDYQQTVSLMHEVKFAGAYVFMYSPRPNTGAWNLPDDVPADVKRARCNEIIGIQLQHQQDWYRTLHNQNFEILVEGCSKKNENMLTGRSIGNLNIVFPRYDAAGNSRDYLIGDLATIKIDRSTNLTLYGDVVA